MKDHPPLPMLILWILRWIGRAGANWTATLLIALGASAAAAIDVATRTIASENLARRAVPFLILTPTAICLATSMNTLFLGIATWSVALLTQATKSPHHVSPRPPRGTIPLLSFRAVDWGGKGFHRLWITSLRSRSGEGPFAGGLLVGSSPYLSHGLVSILAIPSSSWPSTVPGEERRSPSPSSSPPPSHSAGSPGGTG